MMALRVYNTLTRRKEVFEPLHPGEVRMYVCGPNLYGPTHVGHAMSYLVFDVIRRYLEYRGFRVSHVQNFTDIEDRIIETAREQGTTIEALAARYIERFLREMDALGVRRATVYPRATEAIPTIIEIVQTLVARGLAYASDGDVFFRVSAFPAYGRLSGRSLDEMQAGARIDVDPRKEHPMDFVLWKAAKPGEPAWDSPWGPGRPGWHIECSAMSTAHLGPQLDIHGGGQDVIFPHHENEIAQSEGYTGTSPFVRYWVHNGLLRLTEGEEKMTRHLGNIITIREALDRYHPDTIRVFVLSSHYRSPTTWSEDALAAAARGAERLRTAVETAEELLTASAASPAAAGAPPASAQRAPGPAGKISPTRPPPHARRSRRRWTTISTPPGPSPRCSSLRARSTGPPTRSPEDGRHPVPSVGPRSGAARRSCASSATCWASGSPPRSRPCRSRASTTSRGSSRGSAPPCSIRRVWRPSPRRRPTRPPARGRPMPRRSSATSPRAGCRRGARATGPPATGSALACRASVSWSRTPRPASSGGCDDRGATPRRRGAPRRRPRGEGGGRPARGAGSAAGGPAGVPDLRLARRPRPRRAPGDRRGSAGQAHSGPGRRPPAARCARPGSAPPGRGRAGRRPTARRAGRPPPAGPRARRGPLPRPPRRRRRSAQPRCGDPDG